VGINAQPFNQDTWAELRGATIEPRPGPDYAAPTFLQIAGTPARDDPDGVSLLGLLHGEPPPANWQRAVLVEHHGPVTVPGDPDLQSPNAGNPPSYEAMRTTNSLYVEYVTGEREYYDLTRDPNELQNLAGTLSSNQLAELHQGLLALETCHRAAACQRAALPSVAKPVQP
jgi:N-acetylglucosamine-6-sulfatase